MYGSVAQQVKEIGKNKKWNVWKFILPAVVLFGVLFVSNDSSYEVVNLMTKSKMIRVDTFRGNEKYMEESEVEIRRENYEGYLRLERENKFQRILGFGGAFTEAAALQFGKMSNELQEKVLKLYFDNKHGAGYTLGRMHMNSCDFCTESYNFDNVSGDVLLNHFDMNVMHDTEYIIPFVQRALKVQPELNLFLSPWSPPAWMKVPFENQFDMLQSASPRGLAKEYQSSWALYFSKFMTAYRKYGIEFWGLTVQNEAEFDAPWEACMYNASYMADFVKNHLGPTVKKDFPNVNIMIYDHNKVDVLKWAKIVYSDPEARKFVDGIAFHWYSDQARELDGTIGYDVLAQTHHVQPDKFLLGTESCNCPNVADSTQTAWFRAQRYGHDILQDLNHYAIGWVDWNLILNHKGGPNHAGNVCDSPIILSKDEKSILIQPMYYYIAHFSKYIPPGSIRLGQSVHFQYDAPGIPTLVNEQFANLNTCEYSAPQIWKFTPDEKLHVIHSDYCLTNVDGHRVQIWKCWATNTQRWRLIDDQLVNLNDKKCLQNSSAHLTMADCSDPNTKGWSMHTKAASSFSIQQSTSCLTAGYLLGQSAVFQTPSGDTVAIILNENTQPLHFNLIDGSKKVPLTVAANGISTFIW